MGNEQIKPTVAHSSEWKFIQEYKSHPQFGHIKVYQGPGDKLQCLKTLVVDEGLYKDQISKLKNIQKEQCRSIININKIETLKQEEFCSNYVKIFLTADYSTQQIKSLEQITDIKKFIIEITHALEILTQTIDCCQFCLNKIVIVEDNYKIINTQFFLDSSDYEQLYLNDVNEDDWMVAPEVMQNLRVNRPIQFDNQKAAIFSFGIVLLTLLSGIHPKDYQIYNYKELQLNQNKFEEYLKLVQNLQTSQIIQQIITDCLQLKATLRPTFKDIQNMIRQIEIPLQISHFKEIDIPNQLISFNPCYDDVKKVLCESNIHQNLNFHNDISASPQKHQEPEELHILNETQQSNQFRKSKQIYNLENTNNRQSVQQKQSQQFMSTTSMKGKINKVTKQTLQQQIKSPTKKPKMLRATRPK